MIPVTRDAEPGAVAGPSTDTIPLDVAVVYADDATRERALRVYDHLHAQLGLDFELHFTWWHADFLRHEDMRQAALQAALAADLVLFAMHGAEPLPRPVETWLELWLARREPQPSPLVARLGGTPEAAAAAQSVQSLLQRAAQDAGMEFLPHSFPLRRETPCCLVDHMSERVHLITPLLEEILTRRPTVQRWGLNE